TREGEDRVVLRREPGAAAVDGRAVGKPMGPDATADAVARLEHDDRFPGLREPARCGEPGVTGADDADVHVDALSHRPPPGTRPSITLFAQSTRAAQQDGGRRGKGEVVTLAALATQSAAAGVAAKNTFAWRPVTPLLRCMTSARRVRSMSASSARPNCPF